MKVPFGAKESRNAQTLVFFLLCWGTIMLLCGLAIDSGLLYLAKARLGRAVDGAALAAVGNFNRSTNAQTNRDDVAMIMRNFAVANYTGLGTISNSITTSGGTPVATVGSNGKSQTSYQYSFNDGTQDANGQYRRFVQVTLNTGSGGNITSATCNARCPVTTYFIGYGYYFLGNGQSANYAKIGGYSGPSNLVDLKVSSSAQATRNPRLIEVVIDRSASMLANGGGASGLPPAIVQFLDFFDTSSDNIGIVSFGTVARVEMPITTNFLIAGTNNLTDAYTTVTNSLDPYTTAPYGIPGEDPEMNAAFPSTYQAGYATNGVRRLKFGGSTCADDGIRLGMEQMMANSGFNDPDVIKYMVIFTDGAWNTARTLFTAPGYTNFMYAPTNLSSTVVFTNTCALVAPSVPSVTNGSYGDETKVGSWSTTLTADTNMATLPSLSAYANMTNAAGIDDLTGIYNGYNGSPSLAANHTNDVWLSADGINEPLGSPSQIIGGSVTAPIVSNTFMYKIGTTNYYTPNVDVWLQPGAVAYFKTNSAGIVVPYVSDYTDPTKHVYFHLGPGGYVELVVPGYIVDGSYYDGLDMGGNGSYSDPNYPYFRTDNYQQPFEWGDDYTGSVAGSANPYSSYYSASLERQLAFRNYVNMLTGFYVSDPDDPTGTGNEPLITEQNPPGAPRPLFGMGPYYPGAPFYWPFGGETNSSGYVTNSMGLAYDPTYALMNPSVADPDIDQTYAVGGSRHNAYSLNMLSPMAAPQWSGEVFYESTTGGGTNVISGSSPTSASQLMQSANWQTGLPSFDLSLVSANGVMTNEATHNSNISGSPSVWRPANFNGGSANDLGTGATALASVILSGGSVTGGYVADGPQGAATTHYYKNTMAWSGRPTHYFDFSKSSWEPIANNHINNAQALPLGNWKAWEYAWHARALGVTIFTVGYGTKVSDAQQAYLAQIANATNTTAGGGTAITYNATQPIGQQFYATNEAQISNDFYSVGQAINEALTGGQ